MHKKKRMPTYTYRVFFLYIYEGFLHYICIETFSITLHLIIIIIIIIVIVIVIAIYRFNIQITWI